MEDFLESSELISPVRRFEQTKKWDWIPVNSNPLKLTKIRSCEKDFLGHIPLSSVPAAPGEGSSW